MPATVLVVDDDPDTRALIAAVLDSEGYGVEAASDGSTALAKAHAVCPDVVLLDACMPGMDGFEVCERFKADERLGSIPVVFMTALAAGKDVVRGFHAGGADYVTKPIQADALLARLETHVERARQQRQAEMALNVGGRAALIVNGRGIVQWHSLRARDLLRRYFDAGIDAPLPATLMRWFGSRKATSRPYKAFYGKSQLSVRLAGPAGDDGWILALAERNEADLIADFSARFMLTSRQAEVLLWVSRGKTNSEIAAFLGMKTRTVDKHLEHIFPQLGVETRAAAAAIALEAIG